jgi:predicted nucleic acid-binding protein
LPQHEQAYSASRSRNPLRNEITGVLREKFRWSEDELAEAMARIAQFTRLVQPSLTLNVVPDDPDDNRVLECAAAAGSSFIVTGDAHLLRLRRYQQIEIVKVADFLRLVPTC